MDAWVVVSRQDGTSERHRVEGTQATVGRSPTAGIPLVNCGELMPEHMLVQPMPDGCWVAVAKGAAPPVLVNGKRIEGEVVPWGSVLKVGETSILVTNKLVADRREGEKRISSPVLALLFLAIPVLGWLLLSETEAELPLSPGGPPPDLFSEVEPCAGTGEEALHRAREAAEAASHRSERYPFDAQDGVRAVDLYGDAQACYEAAGHGGSAARMRRERDALMRRLNEDYRTHRLRLERALEHQHYEDALVEAKSLVALLRHRQGDPYATWIELLERRLQLMMDMSVRPGQE